VCLQEKRNKISSKSLAPARLFGPLKNLCFLFDAARTRSEQDKFLHGAARSASLQFNVNIAIFSQQSVKH
jgi:hypothetical protein